MPLFYRTIIGYTERMMAEHHNRLYVAMPVLLVFGIFVGIVVNIPVWWAIFLVAFSLFGWIVSPYIFHGMGGYGFRAGLIVLFAIGWVNGWINQSLIYKIPFGGVIATTGTVSDIIYRDGKTSYILDNARAVRLKHKGAVIDQFVYNQMVDIGTIRLTGQFAERFKPDIGDIVQGKAIILNHLSPDFVGGFDMDRYLLSRGMVTMVYSSKKNMNSWKNRKYDDGTVFDAVMYKISQLRHNIMENISKVSYGKETADNIGSTKSIAMALMLGKRDYISKEDSGIIRDAGLSHIMAISGMHVGLLVVIVFFVIRRLFTLIPSISLKYDTKALAIILSLPVVMFYVLISGMGIPAIRALGMGILMLFGILIGRDSITLRIVAVVAMIMMLVNPITFMDVGFLLSFSAVTALVVFAEFYNKWVRQQGDNKPFL